MTEIQEILKEIQKIVEYKGSAVIAIDGRCASGKTTLASQLQALTDGNLIHCDDFFLQPYQRNALRYSTPGENIDHERFLTEVLQPLSKHVSFSYHRFDCFTKTMQESVAVQSASVTIIEGSYSLRMDFQKYYDLKIFMTVKPEIQLERLEKRDPAKLKDFQQKWIPMEEVYISKFHPETNAQIIIDTTDLL